MYGGAVQGALSLPRGGEVNLLWWLRQLRTPPKPTDEELPEAAKDTLLRTLSVTHDPGRGPIRYCPSAKCHAQRQTYYRDGLLYCLFCDYVIDRPEAP